VNNDGADDFALLDHTTGQYHIVHGRAMTPNPLADDSKTPEPYEYEMGYPLQAGRWADTGVDVSDPVGVSAHDLPRLDGVIAEHGLMHSADVGEFNQDGYTETLLWDDDLTTAYLLYGPAGAWEGNTPIDQIAHTVIELNGWRPVGEAADIDGDGDDDILLLGSWMGPMLPINGVQMIPGDPNIRATFEAGRYSPDAITLIDFGPAPLPTVDVIDWDHDEDGRSDLMVSYPAAPEFNTKVAVVTGEQMYTLVISPEFGPMDLTLAELQVSDMGPADWDESLTLSYLGLSPGQWSYAGTGTEHYSNWSAATAADVDADGKDEIAVFMPQQWTFENFSTGQQFTVGALYVIDEERAVMPNMSLGSPWSAAGAQAYAPILVMADSARVDISAGTSTGALAGIASLGDVDRDGSEDIALYRGGSETNGDDATSGSTWTTPSTCPPAAGSRMNWS